MHAQDSPLPMGKVSSTWTSWEFSLEVLRFDHCLAAQFSVQSVDSLLKEVCFVAVLTREDSN